MFKIRQRIEVQDWITPAQVDIVSVETSAERTERMTRRVNELKAKMGSRYLLDPENRVRRLDAATLTESVVRRNRLKLVAG